MAKKIKITKASKSTATITEIRGDSSATVQIGTNFFKISYGETRIIPPYSDMDEERKLLFDDLNKVVDDQIQDLLNATTNK